jgi:hypothetical protein
LRVYAASIALSLIYANLLVASAGKLVAGVYTFPLPV